MNKVPYNCFISIHGSSKGNVVPKSAYVRYSKELRNWLVNEMHFSFHSKDYDKENDWLLVSISTSYQGYIYHTIWTETDTQCQTNVDNPYCKIFDYDEEAFKKYIGWTKKLGPWFTKQNFKKK